MRVPTDNGKAASNPFIGLSSFISGNRNAKDAIEDTRAYPGDYIINSNMTCTLFRDGLVLKDYKANCCPWAGDHDLQLSNDVLQVEIAVWVHKLGLMSSARIGKFLNAPNKSADSKLQHQKQTAEVAK